MNDKIKSCIHVHSTQVEFLFVSFFLHAAGVGSFGLSESLETTGVGPKTSASKVRVIGAGVGSTGPPESGTVNIAGGGLGSRIGGRVSGTGAIGAVVGGRVSGTGAIGAIVGRGVGLDVGRNDGCNEGFPVEGCDEGLPVGIKVGLCVGF